ncbi:hypothetical protein [uncultured Umboniibacter sp.]|uniref:hypothetical protein n=1 Tax=uncultured Umboniibacter sp. TaxID=1798917 RepID=UPI002623B812|nr:hypothetical protein [uncultured Umboniibacter sp.]
MKIERTIDVSIKQGQSTSADNASAIKTTAKATGVATETAQVSAQVSFADKGSKVLADVVVPEDSRVEELRLAVAAGEFDVDDKALAAALTDQFLGDR